MAQKDPSPYSAQPIWLAPSGLSQLEHFDSAFSQVLATGSGWITHLSINTPSTSGTLTLYDGVDATGMVMAVIDTSKSNPNSGGLSPWPYQNGLFVTMTGNADVTIVHSPSP